MELTNDQKNTFKKAIKWWRTSYQQVFVIQGRPGTGKTTVINKLIEEFNVDIRDVLFVTYVGRATLPLRKNGLAAKTIHSACYYRKEDYILDQYGNPIILKNNRYKKEGKFVLRPQLPDNIRLIVVDEGGMVPGNMCDDLESFGIPIIVTGDRDQLPPVFGKCRWMGRPDAVLFEIMRQKKGDPIIMLAEKIVNGEELPYGKYGKRCFVVDEEILKYPEIYLRPDIVICGRNKTREKINSIVRHEVLGFDTLEPQLGDKMVCRKNNWNITVDNDIALINGLFGTVEHMYPESYKGRSLNMDFKPECSSEWFEDITIDLDYLKMTPEERKIQKWYNGNVFEYGYASTCHMAQGSQYGYVMAIDEAMGDANFHRKYLYTAVTRAEHTLVVVRKKKKKNFFMNF